jgi:hypothetical protein
MKSLLKLAFIVFLGTGTFLAINEKNWPLLFIEAGVISLIMLIVYKKNKLD